MISGVLGPIEKNMILSYVVADFGGFASLFHLEINVLTS